MAKNTRLCIFTAGRERTFEGVPIHGGGGRRYNKNPPKKRTKIVQKLYKKRVITV